MSHRGFRAAQICRQSSGYGYYVSLKGVTGAANIDVTDVAQRLARIRSHTKLPVGVGFGVSKPAHVRAIAKAGADGVIIEVHHKPEEALSDGPQALLPDAFAQLVREVDAIAQVLGRSLQPAEAAAQV